MKNILKLIALIMVLSLILCGCGEPKPAESQPTDPTGTTNTDPTGSSDVTVPSVTDPVDDGKKTYTVTVVDQNGNPVTGVSVQFCDENNTCQLPVKTDADGVVSKNLPEMVYHVTLTLPEGYSCDTLEYYMEGTTELTVTVNAN